MQIPTHIVSFAHPTEVVDFMNYIYNKWVNLMIKVLRSKWLAITHLSISFYIIHEIIDPNRIHCRSQNFQPYKRIRLHLLGIEHACLPFTYLLLSCHYIFLICFGSVWCTELFSSLSIQFRQNHKTQVRLVTD